MFLSQKIVSSQSSTLNPCIPSMHPFHTFFPLSFILYSWLTTFTCLPHISSLLSPSYPSALVHESSLCKYYSKSLVVGLMKNQVLQNTILCWLVISQESFNETILQKSAIILATFLMYKMIWSSLAIMNLPGNTNRKNEYYRRWWIQVLWDLNNFWGPLYEKEYTIRDKSEYLFMTPPRDCEGAPASEGHWNFINFTFNLPLTTDRTTVVDWYFGTCSMRKWGKKEGKGGQGVWVSTCLNEQQINEKHQSQIQWLLEQLQGDFCKACMMFIHS